MNYFELRVQFTRDASAEKVEQKANAIGLKLAKQREMDGWIMARFIKSPVG